MTYEPTEGNRSFILKSEQRKDLLLWVYQRGYQSYRCSCIIIIFQTSGLCLPPVTSSLSVDQPTNGVHMVPCRLSPDVSELYVAKLSQCWSSSYTWVPSSHMRSLSVWMDTVFFFPLNKQACSSNSNSNSYDLEWSSQLIKSMFQ